MCWEWDQMMTPNRKKSKRRAQTSTEYIILVVIVALLAMRFGDTLSGRLKTFFEGNFDDNAQEVQQIWR